MSDRFKSHIAVFSANLIYGINYTVAKGIMPTYMKPFGLVFCRVAVGILIFWMISYFFVKEKVEKKDIVRLIFASIFGVAINQMLFLNGLNFTTPIDASIIMTTNPILVLIIASLLIRERITWRKVLGIIIGAVGAGLLILNSGRISLASEQFVGNVMIFANALSYGIYLVLIKPLMLKYHPITVMKWVFLSGFFFIFPFGFNDFIHIDWSNIPVNIYLSILYVLLFSTVIAYLLNVFGLKRLNASTVSIYIYSQPVIASFVAVLSGKDVLTFVKVFSTILVFAGVYLVSIPRKKQTIEKIA